MKPYQKGQAALIALLVLTIATTVGLSLIARGTTDVSITRNIEESTRAFSAAEAGVEEALRTGVGGAGPTLDTSLGLTYNVTVGEVGGAASVPFVFPQKTLVGVTETIWLVDHMDNDTIDDSSPNYTANTIDVCWGSEATTPAVVVTVLYKESSDASYQVAKVSVDPDGSRRSVNNFIAPTASSGGCGGNSNTTYKYTLAFNAFSGISPGSDILIALRVRPVYSTTQLAVTPFLDLPIQGRNIESVGQTGSGINRKIVVFQSYKSPATLFDAAVYSQNSFNH